MKYSFILFLISVMLQPIMSSGIYNNNHNTSNTLPSYCYNYSTGEYYMNPQVSVHQNPILPSLQYNDCSTYTNEFVCNVLVGYIETNEYSQDIRYYFYRSDFINHQPIYLTTDSFPIYNSQDEKCEFKDIQFQDTTQLSFSEIQKHDFQPRNENPVLAKNNIFEKNSNTTQSEIEEKNKKSEKNNSKCLSNQNSPKKIYSGRLTYDLNFDLKNMWTNLILKNLDESYPGLLESLHFSRTMDVWNKLDDYTGMFQVDMNADIEFYKPSNFNEFTFFRKKHFINSNEFIYQYLTVKGDPEKNLKRLVWKGHNIFIMDCSNIGEGVTIHRYSYIGPNCKIGENTCILRNCFLKKNVEIEKNTFIGIKNIFGEGCKIGYKNKGEFSSYPELDSKSNNMMFSLYKEDHKFKTIIGPNNYIGENVFLPYGYHYRSSNHYYCR